MNFLFTFENIHYVMIAEEILKVEKIDYNLIPTPESISKQCGMSLEIDDTLKDKTVATLKDKGINSFKIYEENEKKRRPDGEKD